MDNLVRTMADDEIELMRSIVRDPSLAEEFETLQAPGGLEDAFADAFGRPSWRWLGWADGQPAGAALAFVLKARSVDFAIVRLGVVEPHRRHGLGRALLETVTQTLVREAPHCGELCISGYIPSPAASGFAEALGYAYARYFWMMERPHRPVDAVAWPHGIETRLFDGSDQAFEDWNTIYNDSFAAHWHSIETTVTDARQQAAQSKFDPDGLILAYRDGVCVGFCRNDVYGERGEIGTIGTSVNARGLGLGRALLRWGTAWLQQRGVRVTLFVDGENESALRLYRSEGYEKVMTRQIWARKLEVSSPQR